MSLKTVFYKYSIHLKVMEVALGLSFYMLNLSWIISDFYFPFFFCLTTMSLVHKNTAGA